MANTTAIFAATPNTPQARISAANTARDGSGTLTTLFTAGANGSRVELIKFISAQASAAASSSMVVRVFITDTSGANPRLLIESVMTTLTPSTTAIGSAVIMDLLNGITTNNATITSNAIVGGLKLASGQLLKVSQSVYAGVQDQNDVIAFGGDF